MPDKKDTDLSKTKCPHPEWDYASTVTLNTEPPALLVMLYCPKCAEVKAKVIQVPFKTKEEQAPKQVLQPK